MAAPAAVAKAVLAAVDQFLKEDEDGEKQLKKVLIATICAIVAIALFVTICTQILLVPMNNLTELFLPDSITDARQMIDQAWNRPVIVTGERGFLSLPVTDMTTSSTFGWRTLYGKQNWHEGLDFPVPMGTPIMSIAPGTVVAAGVDASYGQYIKIRHEMQIVPEEDDGGEEDDLEVFRDTEVFYSFYAHLSAVYVFVGEAVGTGERIALSGGDNSKHFAGNSTGAHLHIEIRTTPNYGSEVDPYDWLLKPLTSEEEEIKERTEFIADGRAQGVLDW